jgi:hypothetical protein
VNYANALFTKLVNSKEYVREAQKQFKISLSNIQDLVRSNRSKVDLSGYNQLKREELLLQLKSKDKTLLLIADDEDFNHTLRVFTALKQYPIAITATKNIDEIPSCKFDYMIIFSKRMIPKSYLEMIKGSILFISEEQNFGSTPILENTSTLVISKTEPSGNSYNTYSVISGQAIRIVLNEIKNCIIFQKLIYSSYPSSSPYSYELLKALFLYEEKNYLIGSCQDIEFTLLNGGQRLRRIPDNPSPLKFVASIVKKENFTVYDQIWHERLEQSQ